jgi:XTP/dITP diphosphohydrolase
MKLLLASGSAHKVTELRRILDSASVSVEVVGLANVEPYPEPVENGATFEENALIKARVGFNQTGLVTLADDSGIEVDVLNQMPGVRSARWAGSDAGDGVNLDLLIRQIEDVDDERRSARFVCAMAVVTGDQEIVVRGVVEGNLARVPRGDHGFGYDPIFVPEGETRTTAEMTDEEKDAISHRGRALRAMIPRIEELASCCVGSCVCAQDDSGGTQDDGGTARDDRCCTQDSHHAARSRIIQTADGS